MNKTTHPEPLARLRFAADELVQQHPPRLFHKGKQVVYETACPPGTIHAGELSYSRWPAMPLPESSDPANARQRVHIRPTIYDYVDPDVGAVHWHVNFADARLFSGCGTSMLAQDELQVAEHPVLASLAAAPAARGKASLTVENGQPTPILVRGAERRCAVAIDVNLEEGRPHGLYGALFGVASTEVIRRATQRLDPPTVSNIIAIVAPSGGEGAYAEHEIEQILTTAYTGFRAAVIETETECGYSRATIHTGWWGCGVFGGNKVLMAMLQIAAAHMAEVLSLHFYSVTDHQIDTVEYALERMRKIGESGPLNTAEFIRRVAALELRWGVGDGN